MAYQGAHTGAEVDDAVGAAKGAGNGLMVKSGSGTGTRRTLIGSTGIDVTNADGTAGNPTVALDSATQSSLALADSAIQPEDLGSAALTDSTDYATAAQGTKADSALQPGATVGVNTVAVSASKTLALTDANKEQLIDASGAVVVTIPTNAAVALSVGDKVSVLTIGTGAVSLTADTGVTLNGVSAGSADLSAQYSAAVLTKVGTDAWVVNGDHTEVS